MVCVEEGSIWRQQIPVMAIKTDANYAGIIVENVRDKCLGWPRVIHEGIQLTTDTAALLGYLLARLFSEFYYELNDLKRSEHAIVVLMVHDYMVARRQQLLTDIRQRLLV